jgi:hypothetical protein
MWLIFQMSDVTHILKYSLFNVKATFYFKTARLDKIEGWFTNKQEWRVAATRGKIDLLRHDLSYDEMLGALLVFF